MRGLLLLALLLLISLGRPVRCSGRADLIGYTESGGGAECTNKLGSELCESYRAAAMCKTPYIADSCKKSCNAC